MKNQYFGNGRDVFKYDLLLDVLEAVPTLTSLTLIPMLTPDGRNTEGRYRAIAPEARHADLLSFLQTCRQDSRLHVKELRAYFAGRGIVYHPYRDDRYIESASRSEYFESIPLEWLAGALVFFDPDVGLEPNDLSRMRREGPEKYLLFSEVTHLLDRSHESAFVIYQHLQRNKAKIAGDILEKAAKLRASASVPTLSFVTDQDVVFYGLARSKRVHQGLSSAFHLHASRHRGLVADEVAI